MKWNQQQGDALRRVAQWLADKNRHQVFQPFGFAGTGKTTLAVHVRDQVDGGVVFGAFTGEAALVMHPPCGRVLHQFLEQQSHCRL